MELTPNEKDLRYQTMVTASRRLLASGHITQKEFARIEDYLNTKYQPLIRTELT